MSEMGGMTMPGGWTMSMTWMRMPGQTWPGAAAEFVGMWSAMMVAMMLPSLLPMLMRYREAVAASLDTTAGAGLGRLTTLVGFSYFFVWTLFGMAIYPLGIALAQIEMQHPDVSRAPLAKLQAYKRRMGWTFPWASSFVSEFNFDFHVSFTEQDQREGLEYNYQHLPPEAASAPVTQVAAGPVERIAAGVGTDVATFTRERPGMSTFVLEDGVVYHAYSTYSRGVDGIWGMYQWLDRAPKGRNETDLWWRRKDEYGKE
jgi:hypothetical protein